MSRRRSPADSSTAAPARLTIQQVKRWSWEIIDRRKAGESIPEAVGAVWERRAKPLGLPIDGDEFGRVASAAATGWATTHEGRVEDELRRLRARREAARILDREGSTYTGPAGENLADLLAADEEPDAYLIDGLWPRGGKVMLSAAYKAGKTTLVGNLARALADGDPFLAPRRPGRDGRPRVYAPRDGHPGFKVEPLAETDTVFIIALEMTRAKFRHWLMDQGIRRSARIGFQLMRGRLFDPRDAAARAEWAEHLRERRVRVLIVDPLAALLSALGIPENDNTEVGRVLHAFDALVAEAGARELFIAHHTGHDTERSRGAAALRGWPDVEWRVMREQAAPGREPPPDAARFFAAEGRDVAESERLIVFDAESRTLSLGEGNRSTHTGDRDAEAVHRVIRDHPGITKNDLETACGVPRNRVRASVKELLSRGSVHVHYGSNRREHHHDGPHCETCPGEGQGPDVPPF